MFSLTKSTVAIAAAGTMALASAASAGISGDFHDMTWEYNGISVDLFSVGNVEDLGGGGNLWSGSNFELDENFTMHQYQCTSWVGQGNGGTSSFIDAAFEVTNNSSTTETFQLIMTLAVGPHGPNTERSGSVAATVTNNQFGGSGILSAINGGSVYTAWTDLVDPMTDPPAATLMDDPFSIEAATPFGSADDDQSLSATVGPMVNNTISIMFEFDLTAGDSASVSGLFQIAAVPAPGAFALLGVAGLAGRRRRRR